MKYKVWNRVEMINGVASSHFLNQQPFKDYKGDIILIYADNGKVSNVECKDILASVHKIDKTLPLDEFMAVYVAKLEEMNKASEEIIEE